MGLVGLGLGGTRHIEGGAVARARRAERGRRGIHGRDDGSRLGTRGGWKETEKLFSSGRGCVSLWRGVPGRDRGSDGSQTKW